MPDPEVYKIKDIARILKISIPTAYELARKPEFPAIKIEKAIRISREAFEKWLSNNGTYVLEEEARQKNEFGKTAAKTIKKPRPKITVRGIVVFPDGSEKPIEELTPQERRQMAYNGNKAAAEAMGFKVKPKNFLVDKEKGEQ